MYIYNNHKLLYRWGRVRIIKAANKRQVLASKGMANHQVEGGNKS